MATYFVASGGSNTSPYDTWAKASTSLATALAAASTNGDIVVIQYDGVPSTDAEIAADTTYTTTADILLTSGSNDGGSAWTPTAMGTANWIGNSTTNRGVIINGSFRVMIFGLTLRVSGSTTFDSITIGSIESHYEVEECYLWIGNTNISCRIQLGSAATNSYVKLKNCTLRFGNTSQFLVQRGRLLIEGGSISSAGSSPTTLFQDGTDAAGIVEVVGCDLSVITGTLVGNYSTTPHTFTFRQCKLGSGVTVLASQTPSSLGTADVWTFDCSSGDQHYQIGYYNAFGSMLVDTGIYANDNPTYDGTNKCSWKIVTTSACALTRPFVSPWITKYHSGTSAITPYFEILRDGSTTAFQDDQVWGEWAYKGTTGSTIASMVNDRRNLSASATDQAAGVGLSGWTGEAASAWSGKLAPASTITPAEIGDLSARVCVGAASTTVYVDPQIKGT